MSPRGTRARASCLEMSVPASSQMCDSGDDWGAMWPGTRGVDGVKGADDAGGGGDKKCNDEVVAETLVDEKKADDESDTVPHGQWQRSGSWWSGDAWSLSRRDGDHQPSGEWGRRSSWSGGDAVTDLIMEVKQSFEEERVKNPEKFDGTVPAATDAVDIAIEDAQKNGLNLNSTLGMRFRRDMRTHEGYQNAKTHAEKKAFKEAWIKQRYDEVRDGALGNIITS